MNALLVDLTTGSRIAISDPLCRRYHTDQKDQDE